MEREGRREEKKPRKKDEEKKIRERQGKKIDFLIHDPFALSYSFVATNFLPEYFPTYFPKRTCPVQPFLSPFPPSFTRPIKFLK